MNSATSQTPLLSESLRFYAVFSWSLLCLWSADTEPLQRAGSGGTVTIQPGQQKIKPWRHSEKRREENLLEWGVEKVFLNRTQNTERVKGKKLWQKDINWMSCEMPLTKLKDDLQRARADGSIHAREKGTWLRAASTVLQEKDTVRGHYLMWSRQCGSGERDKGTE